MRMKLWNEAWGFSNYDVDHAEGAARRNFKADVEIAALTPYNVGHNFADPLRLDCPRRSWSAFGIGYRPIHQTAHDVHARIQQVPSTRPHLNSLPQASAS